MSSCEEKTKFNDMAYLSTPALVMGLNPYGYTDEYKTLMKLFKRYMIYSGHKSRGERPSPRVSSKPKSCSDMW